MSAKRERGQVLVLFAGALVGLVALSALAIDLASVYSTQQTEKAAADAAALAGAQDLQTPGSRGPGDPVAARTHALMTLAGRFGVALPALTPGGPCDPESDMTECPLGGTAYYIAMSTPSKTTGDQRSLQVSVFIPSFQLTFSRLLGQNGWNVGKTSVASIGFRGQYALITLRPPNILPSTLDQNRDDVNLAGTNTGLQILQGDVGTNSYVRTNSASMITLASGYLIYHHDNIIPDGWNVDLLGNPKGQWNPALIPDPVYPYPSGLYNPGGTPNLTGYSQWATQAAGAITCPTGTPPANWVAHLGTATWTCYQPGVYTDNKAFSVGTGQAAYLLPGVYWFQSGMSVGGTLAGGLVTTPSDLTHGGAVDLYFTESNTKTLSALNTVNLVLNVGDYGCTPSPTNTCTPTPAKDALGNSMQTPEGLLLTIEVARDPTCFVGGGTTPKLCSDNQNTTVNIGGNGIFEIGGVLYGPSDKMQINANSTSQTGTAGQIISWTVTYGGGPLLTQSYPDKPGNGILHLDIACSGGDTPCSP